MAAQQATPGSLLRQVRELIRLRSEHPALGTRGAPRVLHDGYPLVHTRGEDPERYLVVVNPADRATRWSGQLPDISEALACHGVTTGPDGLVAGPFSYAILAVVSSHGATCC